MEGGKEEGMGEGREGVSEQRRREGGAEGTQRWRVEDEWMEEGRERWKD